MNKVYELLSNTLIDISKEAFAISDYPLSYARGVAVWDLFTLPEELIERAKKECPLVSGNCACLFLEPNSHAPIHVDNHDDGKYFRSLNVLVETNNYNHKTFYYEHKDGWNMFERGTMYGWDYNENDPNLKRVFEMRVVNPTIFWNQQLHNTENYDGERRVMFMWEIHKDVTDEQILEWLSSTGIKYNVLY